MIMKKATQGASNMKVRTSVKAGDGPVLNHNTSTASFPPPAATQTAETQPKQAGGIKVRTSIKAGPGGGGGCIGCSLNHNQSVAKTGGVKVRTSIKAGPGGGYGCTQCSVNHNQSVAKIAAR
ncbi:Hypothetical protein A7982_11677 [Minicystis rosea]|nr:Hypothetical protein A7982_11677 [Minicystis rosea]